MIEGTPGQPYGGTMAEFNTVEDNMRERRQEASSLLPSNHSICTVTSFPRLGCPGFTLPEFAPTPVEKGASKSLFFPDEAINKHPRFRLLFKLAAYQRQDIFMTNWLHFMSNCGIDHLLAQNIAHLFIRDPLTLFAEKIHLDDANESGYFENIQSTNWQTMRFKPPPPNSDIGWRVEFRPMEVHLTDFENSAYVVFVVLLTRVILSYKLDFLIPLSKVDENMKVAQKRDAVRQGMFYFRKDICKAGIAAVDGCYTTLNGTETEPEEYTLMSIDTIINGKEGVFPGLLPVLNSYLENMEVDVDTRCTILNYLKLIKKRASGELMTVARWMREFVSNHPDYKHDSVITDKINYDLLVKCNQIANGQSGCPELFGITTSKTKPSESKTA